MTIHKIIWLSSLALKDVTANTLAYFAGHWEKEKKFTPYTAYSFPIKY